MGKMSEKSHVALTRCYFCGEGAQIILHKRLGDVSGFHDKVVDMVPCSKCEDYMKQGVILLAIDDTKSGAGWDIAPDKGSAAEKHWMPNPFRTGGFFVVRDTFIKKVFSPPELVAKILRFRWSFIEHSAAEKLGLLKAATPPPEPSVQGTPT